MKKLTLLILVCILSATPLYAAPLTLKICYEVAPRPPYFNGSGTIIPPKGERGIAINIIDQSAETLDIEIQWVRFPWKRCIASFLSGNIDSILPTAYRGTIAKAGRYPLLGNGALDTSRKLAPVPFHFYENIDYPIKWTGKIDRSVKDLIIAAPRGYIVTQILKEKGFRVVESLSQQKGLERLMAGKIDAYVYTPLVFDRFIAEHPGAAEKVRKVDPYLLKPALFVPIRKEVYQANPQLIDTFWEVSSKNMKKIFPPELWDD